MRKISILLVALVTLFVTSCVDDEIYGPCTITNISNTIAYTANDAITVTATVSSMAGVSDVTLNYNVNEGSYTEVAMSNSGSTYTGVIPAQALDATVNYYIVAKSTNDDITTSATVTFVVGATPINYSGLVLNELNGNDKFIEIYNRGNEVIPMAGVQLFKDSGTEATWTCDERSINPGEFLLLYSEDVVISGEAMEGYPEALVFHSGLSAKKPVRIELKNPTGTTLDDFNLITCVMTCPASYTRVPDGTGSWFHAAATPGAANSTDNSTPVEGLEGGDPVFGTLADIVLNELNGNTKFIELYNKGTLPVEIEGCYIIKDEEDTTWTADNITIEAGDYLLLYSEDVVVVGGAQEGYPENLVFHSGLSGKKSVAIQLFAPDNTTVDVFLRGDELGGTWGTSITNANESSFARCPNGTGDFKLAAATPDAANPETGDDIPQSK